MVKNFTKSGKPIEPTYKLNLKTQDKVETVSVTTDQHKMRRPNEVYSVTVTNSPSGQSFLVENYGSNRKYNTFAERYDDYVTKSVALFRGWTFDCLVSEFDFYLEISQDGLLHWHGTVKIQNPVRFNHMLSIHKYCSGNLSLAGETNIHVDTIDDPILWNNYITKDYEIMKTRVRSDPEDCRKVIIEKKCPYIGY